VSSLRGVAQADPPTAAVCETVGHGFKEPAPGFEAFVKAHVAAGRVNLITTGVDGGGNASICAW
jgi:hypothetical protein